MWRLHEVRVAATAATLVAPLQEAQSRIPLDLPLNPDMKTINSTPELDLKSLLKAGRAPQCVQNTWHGRGKLKTLGSVV